MGSSTRVAEAAQGPRRCSGAALALLALLAAATLSGCFGGASRRIDVGGYRLQIQCAGRGSPVVVFDSGLGDRLEVWDSVWPSVAARTRICLYDRAGLGRSQPSPRPRTSATIVEELDRLLAASGEPPPYLLVGHSFGGLNVRLYASRHPERVSALVLVDPTPESYPRIDRVLRPAGERSRIEHSLVLASPAAADELARIDQSVAEVARAGPLPPVPVTVLSSGRPREPEPQRQLWFQLQTDLARRVGATTHILVTQSGHYIHFDQPGIVAEAIVDLLERTRREGSVSGPQPPPGSVRGLP